MIIRHATFAMGTRFELVLAGEGEDEASLRGYADDAVREIEGWDQRLSLFRPDSLVSHINRTAAERPVRVERPVFEMLATATDVWRVSGRAFDITMGAVMKHWGFHAERSDPDAGSPPVWGMEHIVLDPAGLTVAFAVPGLSIDLGGIAKGAALDAACVLLREHGVTCALLHAGTSSVATIGAPDDQPDGWRVALGPPGAGAPVVQLRDMSLSVSGQHGRTVVAEGRQLGHIIDPRTGEPAQGAGLSAVVAPLGRVAEAWSTALLVLNGRPAGISSDVLSILRDSTGHPNGTWRIEGDRAGEIVV